jgi:hypothetical protein
MMLNIVLSNRDSHHSLRDTGRDSWLLTHLSVAQFDVSVLPTRDIGKSETTTQSTHLPSGPLWMHLQDRSYLIEPTARLLEILVSDRQNNRRSCS